MAGVLLREEEGREAGVQEGLLEAALDAVVLLGAAVLSKHVHEALAEVRGQQPRQAEEDVAP